MADLKTTAEERASTRCRVERCDRPEKPCAICEMERALLNDLDTLLAENAELFEDLRAVLAGACTSATRAGARDATLRRLEAENARLRAAEAEVERLRALSAEARDMLRDMPWRRGGDALVTRLDRAALGEP